jgi:sigma-54 dependent transcriptional regulator, acetoin dehydrogenase operon transcriptional activator AcoR
MPPVSVGHPDTPRQLFFQTPEQRTALARQQFFEEGTRPSGLVGEAVIQSWMRCASAHQEPTRLVGFEHVSRSREHASLNRNRQLLEACQQEVGNMETALGGTDCRVLLTDARGLVIHATPQSSAKDQPLMHAASRIGVNLAEHTIGTSAPGIVLSTGNACSVAGAEHYFQCLQPLHCAAAPIRDIHGQLAGVLDVTVEAGRFHFDAASMVGMYATTIENRLLQLQSGDHLVLHFQVSSSLLGTPLEALAGVDPAGRVLWLNGVGRRLTGCHVFQQPMAEALFGTTVDALLDLHRRDKTRSLTLPNGLGVWIRGSLKTGDGADFNHAVALAQPLAQQAHPKGPCAEADKDGEGAALHPQTTLNDHNQHLFDSTLARCGGNIAKAARTLGVSRGRLYRHLQRS